MSIEKRLREDAARVSGIQPPADLSSRLRSGLAETKVAAGPGVRRWFKPAMAVLTAAMLVLVLLPGKSLVPVFDHKAGQKETFTDDSRGQKDLGVSCPESEIEYSDKQPHASAPDLEQPPNEEVVGAAPLENLPWGRVGAFTGLAVLTGALWIYEFGRRRQLALALIIPLLTLILGNLWLLRKMIF